MGAVRPPGSKSVTQRLLVLGALAQGTTRILEPLESEDTLVLRDALLALGVPIQAGDETWSVKGRIPWRAGSPLRLRGSGASLRFLLPCLALEAEGPVRVDGSPRLFSRPLAPLLGLLEGLGARWEWKPEGGVLTPASDNSKKIELMVDVSETSQFLSGMAMASAARPEGGLLRWAGAPVSSSYLRLTAHWMSRFGCDSRLEGGAWTIPGGCLRGIEAMVPGDWSAAAPFLCAAAVTGRPVELGGLLPHDPQGDRILVEILRESGCGSSWSGEALRMEGSISKGIEADLKDVPDLAPVLAATAALAPGASVLTGLETLQGKECDRLAACVDLVRWLGGEAQTHGAGTLRIEPGRPRPERPAFDPRGDHRMAFAAAVGGLRWGGELRNPGCVAKSFPGFWRAWEAMLEGRP